MDLDPRLHFVTATAIIVRNRKVSDGERLVLNGVEGSRTIPEFLIAKRAPHEKAFPNKWTVPGGKLVVHEYEKLPHETKYFQYYGIMDWLVRKEVREEVGLEIEKSQYLTDLVFIRPDGFPVVTLSYWAYWKSGDVKLCKDLTEYAWVTAEDGKKYDLIDGIWEEIRDVEKLL
jgi:8-oxo-dGTP pyrophosphatase MutT (NUDIX family)